MWACQPHDWICFGAIKNWTDHKNYFNNGTSNVAIFRAYWCTDAAMTVWLASEWALGTLNCVNRHLLRWRENFFVRTLFTHFCKTCVYFPTQKNRLRQMKTSWSSVCVRNIFYGKNWCVYENSKFRRRARQVTPPQIGSLLDIQIR